MSEREVAPGLMKRWSELREDLVFLPGPGAMTPETHRCDLEVVEFVQVAPFDEEIMVPEAPQVATGDVRLFPGWSEAEADQQRMWGLVGTVIEGNRETRTCPDCAGEKRITCGRCSGWGHVTCTWCHGSGDRSCSSCGGDGRRAVSRTTHNADGSTSTTTDYEHCISCGGSGRDRCTPCLGSGRVTCSTCGGDGKVICQTCSPRGTVDVFIRRTFREAEVRLHVLPVALPEYPQPVRLERGQVEIRARAEATPLDSVADAARLRDRGIAQPDARLFFVRSATATVHMLREEITQGLCASFIDGEPEPVFTVHWTALDRAWTPDRQRRRAFGAAILWAMGPLAAIGFLFARQYLAAVGAALVMPGMAYWLYANPLKAFRMAFVEVTCPKHYHSSTVRCPGCGKDLCHECLLPSVRCPHCRKVVSRAVTHLVEDGQWTRVSETG